MTYGRAAILPFSFVTDSSLGPIGLTKFQRPGASTQQSRACSAEPFERLTTRRFQPTRMCRRGHVLTRHLDEFAEVRLKRGVFGANKANRAKEGGSYGANRANRAKKCGRVMARIEHGLNRQMALITRYGGHMVRPRKLPTNIDEQLFKHIGNAPDGLRIDKLSRLVGDQLSRRSLQRRLSELVDANRLITEGGGRSTRYFLPKGAEAGVEEDYVRLSPSGADVRQLVRRPQAERTPVGYNREFLDQYRPNESSYLTPETIATLTRIGTTANAERPAGTYARQILNRLLVDLAWASSRLEGNTYSLLDTERLIESGKAAEGKDASETQMILNHKTAIEFMVDLGDDLVFNRQNILNFHAILSDNLLADPNASGRLR